MDQDLKDLALVSVPAVALVAYIYYNHKAALANTGTTAAATGTPTTTTVSTPDAGVGVSTGSTSINLGGVSVGGTTINLQPAQQAQPQLMPLFGAVGMDNLTNTYLAIANQNTAEQLQYLGMQNASTQGFIQQSVASHASDMQTEAASGK